MGEAQPDDHSPEITRRGYYGLVLRGAGRQWIRWVARNVAWEVLVLGGLAVSGLVLHRADAGVNAVLTPLAVLAAITAAAMIWSVLNAPVEAYRELQAKEQGAAAQLARLAAGAPRLSFGKADLGRAWQPIDLYPEHPGVTAEPGRVVRVPVINAHGAGEAKQVHARLCFLSDRHDPTAFGPGETQGEWPTEDGRWTHQIDIPGNGQPHMLDVLLIMKGHYQPAYEWTARSRAAHLHGYNIESNHIPVEIEVMGSGPGDAAPHLKETLLVQVERHSLRADWQGPSRDPDAGDNWVSWS